MSDVAFVLGNGESRKGIEINDLKKTFENGSPALKGIDLKINKSVVTTGDINAIEKAIKLTSLPGICYLMGVPKKSRILKVNAWNIMHDQTIKGCLGGNTFPERDIPKFINLEKKGKINLNKIIYKTIKFGEINRGLKMFQSLKTTGRILIKF